ncbi:alkylation response protein AidB-like acyl-CoA dehydrogenase [Polymorphobacter multimanifer]|uniref:Alkylation response protein AidB-like acyl-CoA dehydrogenase n=1 Tax=Polymorphobacter multimanifer TaxID=1070431 RepID=A0A841LDN7_9SPHN|nr:acyl-CoA dehydrogenase family protein [Polymorphobacter multimanifer]MBB6227925.1 alkylation response protein AidB-like acyl-CoA dehydrogenase [Polymorphobacter multimanifer]
MIGFAPTPEQSQLQATARGFAQSEIRPLVERTRHAKAGWDDVKPVFEAGAALGLTKIFVPEALGGLGGSCLDAALILEELGAADVGIASDYFSLTATMPLLLQRAGAQAELAAFSAAPAMVLAGAQSEPNVAGSELMLAGADPAFGPKLAAVREGEGWTLRGEKSAFITNAGVADNYLIIARTDAAQPLMGGLSLFWVPADTPGMSVGRKTPLIGWPLTSHAALHFDDVALPASALLGRAGGAAMLFAMVPEMPVCLAACFVGLARAAHGYALDYAKQRRSMGAPIARAQAVAMKLAEMHQEVTAARLMVWHAAALCETDPMQAAMVAAPAAKVRAVDAAIRCAQLCVETLGGYGVTTEYEAGRFLNDAWIGWSCDFTRDVLMLGIAAAVTGQE